MLIPRTLSFALTCFACAVLLGTADASAASSAPGEIVQAQASPPAPAAPAAPVAPAAGAPDAAAAPEEPIGNVATVTGIATVIRHKDSIALKLKDDIYLNDVVQTSSNSALGITFNDDTTFNLSANAKIIIDNYVYEGGGKNNSAIFDIARGTVAFVAASVAKEGDMKITTPTATLGIRGTTGLVEVPEGAAAGSANNVAIKLYPDADGKVGRIEVNDRLGARLGFLTQGASGFTIRPGAAGGARFAAVPLAISREQAVRDQGFVRQVHAAQDAGRRIVTEQRAIRRANPALAPGRRGNPPAAPGPQRRPDLRTPAAPARPGERRPELHTPAAPARPGAPATPPAAAPKPAPHPAVAPRPGTPAPATPPAAAPKTPPRPAAEPRPATPAPAAPELRRGGPLNKPAPARRAAPPAAREKKKH
jgi:hypothetical protein